MCAARTNDLKSNLAKIRAMKYCKEEKHARDTLATCFEIITLGFLV